MTADDLYNRSSLATAVNAAPDQYHDRFRRDAIRLVELAVAAEREAVARYLDWFGNRTAADMDTHDLCETLAERVRAGEHLREGGE